MDDVNYIERWLIQRQEPNGIIAVRVDFADGTDHVMSVSPGRIGTDISEQGTDCWHCTAAIAAPASSIFILGTYQFGPFSSVEFANRFGMRLTECINDPNPSKYEAGWLSPLQQTYQDAAQYHRGVDAPPPAESTSERRMLTSEELDQLHADAERYRRLSTDETVDNERLVNATSYEALISSSDKYDALLNGNEVDGKRLLSVSYVQRMCRLADTVGGMLASIDSHVRGGDLEHLGFTLERTDR